MLVTEATGVGKDCFIFLGLLNLLLLIQLYLLPAASGHCA